MEKISRYEEENFFLNNFNFYRIFNSSEIADYIFLFYIKCSQDEAEGDRVYLSGLSEVMDMPIPELSKAVEKLQDKGYVIWKTDHDAGKTFVELTSKAIEMMGYEKTRMRKEYEMIRTEIGEDELEQMLQTMKKVAKLLLRSNEQSEDSQ